MGIEEATEDSATYLTTMRCVSQYAKTFAIKKSNFEIILKEKNALVNNKLHILSAKHDLRVIDMIERRGKLKNKVQNLHVDHQFTDLMHNRQDPDRNTGYQSNYCTFEMSETDLKNIKLNQNNTIPLSQYINKTEDNEIDYNSFQVKRQRDDEERERVEASKRNVTIDMMNPHMFHSWHVESTATTQDGARERKSKGKKYSKSSQQLKNVKFDSVQLVSQL